MLNTPVLFIVFNRPDTTARVFEAIKQAKPKQLFVAADGPRPNKDGEKERCEIVRQIATKVDWDCELRTLFRSENRGCGRGPAEAITWFFENVEQGIILEDDCLPDQSFFWFCEELLEFYKDDERIMNIGGTNTLGSWRKETQDYFFSNYSGIWGWATWRRAWRYFDYSLEQWRNLDIKRLLPWCLASHHDYEYRAKKFDETILLREVTWWDYQWHLARLSQSGLGIIPSVNLVSNIGFGEDATHTFQKDSIYSDMSRNTVKIPVRKKSFVMRDAEFDELVVATKISKAKTSSFMKFVRNFLQIDNNA